MNNGALIGVPAGRDEQCLNMLSLSTLSKGASGGLPGINTILKIQFTCPNPNPYAFLFLFPSPFSLFIILPLPN